MRRSGSGFSLFLTLVALCALLVLSAFAKHTKGIQIKNRGQENLWVEMTDEEGFFLPPGQLASIIVDEHWSGRIYAQLADCKTQKCFTPYTTAEFKFLGEDKTDVYYVSIKDGFNRPIKIQPTNQNQTCKSAMCQANINQFCPLTHQVKNDEGHVLACKPVMELFGKLCPSAVASKDNTVDNTFRCVSNTYLVLIE